MIDRLPAIFIAKNHAIITAHRYYELCQYTRLPAMPAAANDQGPHRTIIAIAFPAILANSSAPLVGLVDTWAIGHLPDPAYLAAIGLGSVIFNFILWAFGFLRMGTTGIIAQARGKDDKPESGAAWPWL